MKINKKKLKYASISSLFILFFVILILLFNVLVDFLTTRYSLKLDLSLAGEYHLSDETIAFARGIKDDVTIYILKTENAVQVTEYGVRLTENVERYRSESNGHVKYEYVDPNSQVKFLDDYPNATKVKDALVIVASKRRYITIGESEFIDTTEQQAAQAQGQQPNTNKTTYLFESKLNSALLYVTSESVSKVGILTGHNETELPTLTNIFSGNSFETVSLNLVTDDIPADVNNLVLSAPYYDLTANEITKIDNFLAQDGHNLFLFWHSSVTRLPILDRYLTEWGVRVEDSLVLDAKYAVSDQSSVLAQPTKNDKLVVEAAAQNQLLIVPGGHPITTLWAEKNDRTVTSLADTFDTSFAKKITPDLSLADAQTAEDAKGPFSIATLSEQSVTKGDKTSVSRVFVLGTANVAQDQVVATSIALNNSFLNAMVSYANPYTETMQIAPKVVQTFDLNLRTGTVQALLYILVIAIPLLILAAGIFVFFRRRHR